MVYINRTKIPPASLAKEKNKLNGDYNKSDVKELLYDVFFKKCYICEEKPLQDGGIIEHLIPHKGNKDLKFCWENLFLSCSHCNSIKNCKEYENDIIDCTKTDPRTLILHRLRNDVVEIDVLDENSTSAKKTAKLICESFNGKSTVTRIEAATIRVDELKAEMALFLKLLSKYLKSKKTYYKKQLNAMLQTDARFSAFKLDYIKERNISLE